MKKTLFLMVCISMVSSLTFGQYIGVQYQSEKEVESSYYKIFDFNGNLIMQLEDGEQPFFASFMMKHYVVADADWVTTYGNRYIKNNEQFFITEPSQKVLPISTKDNTYLKNFDGIIVKSFGQKFSFLSQPQNGIFIGFRPLEGENGSYMLSYLNEKGEVMFGGREFWEATPFSEGYAIVQESKESDWKVIDRNGDEVTNLSEKFDLKIIEANPFVNGFANIIVRKDARDIEALMGELRKTSNDQNGVYEMHENSGDYESRITSVLYRVSIEGDAVELGNNISVLNDMYYRKYGPEENYNALISAGSNFNKNVQILDSLISPKGKYYLIRDASGENKIMHYSGSAVDFPNRYKPIKCIQDYVLGKRRNKYVLFNPATETSTYFEDQTPLHIGDLMVESKEPLEEFILHGDKMIKVGSDGLSALLNLDGSVVYDFDSSEADAAITQQVRELSEVFECPDEEDFAEIKAGKRSHLFIKCDNINLKAISSLPSLKTLILDGVNSLERTELLGDLLKQKTNISINGKITIDDLDINLKEIDSGALYLNDIELTAKD